MRLLTFNLLITILLCAFVSCGTSTSKKDDDKQMSIGESSSSTAKQEDESKSGAKKPVIYPEIKLSDPKWNVQQSIGRRLVGNYDIKDVKGCEGNIKINVCAGYFTENINLNTLNAVDAEMMKVYPQTKRLADITKIGKYDAIAFSCVGFLKDPDASEIENKNHFIGFFIPDVEDCDNEGKPVLMKIDIEYDYHAEPEYWKDSEAMAIIHKAFEEACQSFTFVETN